MITRRLLPAAVFILLLVLGALPADARQGSFDLDRSQPSFDPTTDSPVRTIPRAEVAPVPSNPELEIPAAYLGCWQGQPHADAWHQYSGPRVERWVPSTVTLCFIRQTSGVEVTYHKQALDEAVNEGRIFNASSRTQALGSAGDRIALRSWGAAQQRGHLFGLALGPTIDIKWMADAICTLAPDQQSMRVEESMNQFCSGTRRCNGGPFISAVWRGTFRKLAVQ